ncbi:hypothetical protein D770_23725 [Flammeovirgaceae bacterium 311]|nr:hypothetical protein D770_23725 [Flammeovirgaceae bacterium 311]
MSGSIEQLERKAEIFKTQASINETNLFHQIYPFKFSPKPLARLFLQLDLDQLCILVSHDVFIKTGSIVA